VRVTPEFQKRLDKVIRLVLYELRNGCCDCMSQKHNRFCDKHHKEAVDIATNPKASQAVQELLGNGEPCHATE
jgi:hypothetical protein